MKILASGRTLLQELSLIVIMDSRYDSVVIHTIGFGLVEGNSCRRRMITTA